MPHIALIGDSIFDNHGYTAGEPDVVSHLRDRLPSGWAASLLAVDGSTIADVPRQLERLPVAATHLAVAVGGNDALMNSDVLGLRAASVAGALGALGERVEGFERAYGAMLDRLETLGRDIILCTIYNGRLEGDLAGAARLALTLFDDVILRAGAARALTIVELRLVCDEPADYANPIEPSGRGGLKIAGAILRAAGAAGSTRSARLIAGEPAPRGRGATGAP